MKNALLYLGLLVTLGMVSCNEAANDNKAYGPGSEPRTQADSLSKSLNDDHNIGMSKMFKLTKAEQTARRLLDSISKLPAKARHAAEPLKVKLDSLQQQLSYAETAMDKWMRELKGDSAINSMQMEERVKYLLSEKLKVSKVKENILNGLQHADSVLKDGF